MNGSNPAGRDPGLQPERTTLAWVRTAIALAAVTLLFLRYVPGPLAVRLVVGGCALLMAGTLVATAARRHTRVSGAFSAGDAAPSLVRSALLVTQVIALATSAAVLVLRHR